jgi:hypothetical protein
VIRPLARNRVRKPQNNGSRFCRLLESAQRSLMDECSRLWDRLFNYCCLGNLQLSTWKSQQHGFSDTATKKSRWTFHYHPFPKQQNTDPGSRTVSWRWESRGKALRTLKTTFSFFWDIINRRVVIVYRRFVTAYRSHLQGSRSPRRKAFFTLEDGPDTLSRNVGTQPPHDAA